MVTDCGKPTPSNDIYSELESETALSDNDRPSKPKQATVQDVYAVVDKTAKTSRQVSKT